MGTDQQAVDPDILRQSSHCIKFWGPLLSVLCRFTFNINTRSLPTLVSANLTYCVPHSPLETLRLI